jgi:hypothetical protein
MASTTEARQGLQVSHTPLLNGCMGRLVFKSFLHTDRKQEVAMSLQHPVLLAADTLYAPGLVHEIQILCTSNVESRIYEHFTRTYKELSGAAAKHSLKHSNVYTFANQHSIEPLRKDSILSTS